MRYLPTVLAGSALIFASGAIAQTTDDMEANTPQDNSTDPAMSGPTMSDPATAGTFTDAQVQSFAGAMLELQALTGDAATKQQQAAAIIADSGIDAETFNAMGAAMQSDDDLARRVRLAAAELQGKPAG